jgi:putative phage-type endonuclease
VIPQDSPDWLRARIGCLTASRFADATARTKSGWSASRAKLLKELLAERLTDSAATHYVSDAMQWGIDHEHEAWMAYEEHTGTLVDTAGLFLHPTIPHCGATPDRLIGVDGVGESKCPTTTTHITWLMNKTVPEEYRPQMLLQLACTKRKWCEFISFDPRMPPKQRLFVRRFSPSADEIATAEQEAKDFLAELEQMFEIITTV